MIYLLKQICMGSFAITSSFASLLFYGLPIVVLLSVQGLCCNVFYLGGRGFIR